MKIETVTTAAYPQASSSLPNTLFKGWVTASALLLAIAVWEMAGQLFQFPFLPPFSAVGRAWWGIYQSGELTSEIISSLQALTIGFTLAVIVGLSLGALMGIFRRVEYFFEPLVDINLATPSLLFVPFLFALFGIGDETRYAIVFMYAVFIIIVNTVAGIRTANNDLKDMAVSFGANQRQVFFKITLISSLPMVVAGLRIGMSRAVKGMINGELFLSLIHI